MDSNELKELILSERIFNNNHRNIEFYSDIKNSFSLNF
jgi:hypothetical protein